MKNKEKIVRFCDIWICRFFYILIVAIPFSRAIVEIASSVIVILWLVKKITQNDIDLPYSPVTLLLLLFFMLNIISMYNTSYVFISVRGLTKYFQDITLFFATVGFVKKPKFSDYDCSRSYRFGWSGAVCVWQRFDPLERNGRSFGEKPHDSFF